MIDRRPVTTAVAAMLATASGMPVGRGRIPRSTADPTKLVDPPYYVLYLVDAALGGAPLADDNEDLTLIYQVTSVSGPNPAEPGSSGTTDQTEWMADKARKAFLARDPGTGLWVNTLTVAGAKVTGRRLDTEPGGTNDPADAIISYVQRFGIDLTSA